MRAALYLRVSTEEQNTENQIAEVRQLAAARAFDCFEHTPRLAITSDYVDLNLTTPPRFSCSPSARERRGHR